MKKLLSIIMPVIAFAVLGLTVLSMPVHASPQTDELCRGSGGEPNAAGECIRPGGEKGLFEDGGIFRNIVNVLIFIVGVISVIMLIIGAIRYTVSGGDPAGVKGAKDTILYALVGIVVAASAFALVNFVISSLNN